MPAAPAPKPIRVKCANCGMVYPKGQPLPCPLGPLGTAEWTNQMLVFMRCTAGIPGKESKTK